MSGYWVGSYCPNQNEHGFHYGDMRGIMRAHCYGQPSTPVSEPTEEQILAAAKRIDHSAWDPVVAADDVRLSSAYNPRATVEREMNARQGEAKRQARLALEAVRLA